MQACKLAFSFCIGLLACDKPGGVPAFDTSPVGLEARSATVSFVICNDMRPNVRPWEDNPLWAREILMRKIVELQPAFVINTGDFVSWGDFGLAWATFDEITAPLRAAGIKYVPALGNHEYLGRNRVAHAHYFARFPGLNGQRWYVYEAGPLRILVLDTNFTELEIDERESQQIWLEAQLALADQNPAVRLVLLSAHHPAYSNAHREPMPEVRQLLVEPARRYPKVVGLLSGHTHSYERFSIDGFDFIVSGGCGAPLKEVEVAPDLIRTQPVFQGPALRGHHLLQCTASASAISCDVQELLGPEGGFKLMDRFELRPRKL